MPKWPLQDAKARFSELVNLCLQEGPQAVTKHGQESVVIVSAEEYRRLTKPKDSLLGFLQKAPRIELDLVRLRDRGREVDL